MRECCSGWSLNEKPCCNRTELNSCTATETRWNNLEFPVEWIKNFDLQYWQFQKFSPKQQIWLRTASVEDDVDVRRYAILELRARNDDDDDWQFQKVIWETFLSAT